MAWDDVYGQQPDAQATPAAEPRVSLPPVYNPSGGTSVPPPAATPPPKTFLDTAFDYLPSRLHQPPKYLVDDPNQPSDTNVGTVRAAFGQGYSGTGEASTSAPGWRSALTPQAQQKAGPWINTASDDLSTALGVVSGVANSAWTLGNETLRATPLPEKLTRDIALEATNIGAPEFRGPVWQGYKPPYAKTGYAEMATPPPATLSELLQRQRAAPPTDPVTQQAISLLRTNTSPTAMPSPPAPFTTTPGPTPQPQPQPPPGPRVPPSGGLLNIPPVPGTEPILSADQILARSRGFFSPADQQAAAGAMIKPDAADGVLKPLTDQVPTDPHTAIATGDTPLVQLGKQYAALQGQPMSYDSVMTLDRRLTDERQAALSSGKNTLASQIQDVQDQIRAKTQSLGNNDSTGDPQVLANLAPARQAYTQYIKQRQIEDLKYDASLLPEDKQNAYMRNRATAMLRGNQTANWTDDERGALEDAVKSGNIGSLTSLGISMIKPTMQAGVGGFGAAVGGPTGGYIGTQVGGSWGDTATARVRAALSKLRIDPVSQMISRGVPPPPPGQ